MPCARAPENQLIEQLVLILRPAPARACESPPAARARSCRRARRQRAELLPLLQTGDADLEELVEVGAGDAEKADALEQRQRLIVRLREHAQVEVEKRQLAIDVVLGSLEITSSMRTVP